MYLRFNCSKCQKDKWLIDYETDMRIHKLSCINCGHDEVLEHVLSTRRVKNVKQPRSTVTKSPPTNASRPVDGSQAEGTVSKVWNRDKQKQTGSSGATSPGSS